jgi:hypothetical protein
MSTTLVVWGTATCAFVALPGPSAVTVAVGVVAAVSFVTAAVLVVFGRLPLESLRLRADLLPQPGFPAYRPDEILRIAFAPDPAEDYAEGRTAAPLCEAAVAFRPHGGLRLVVTVEDAWRLRNWAVARGIEVVETDGVLGGADRGP